MLREIFINMVYILGIVACLAIIYNLLKGIFFPTPKVMKMDDKVTEMFIDKLFEETRKDKKNEKK